MLRKVVMLLTMACMCYGNTYAESNYPYKNVCPNGGITIACVDNNNDGKNDFPCDYWNPSRVINGKWVNLDYWVDRWNFGQCECVSYTAYRMDDELYALAGIHFNNSYRGQHWSHGKYWDDAADAAAIKHDHDPIPGDIAYWNSGGTPATSYGHVAFVERVEYDDDMKWTKVYISEYNGSNGHGYSSRSFVPSSTRWLDNPSGYIHILAHQECATSYYFNRMDAPWAFPEQTQEEWEKIFLLVWDKYRENNGSCDESSQVAFQQLWDAYGGLPGGFGGGSDSDFDDEGQTLNGPDANVVNGFRVRNVGGSWQEGTVTVSPGQEMEASWFIKNKGDETIDYFESFLYLSEDLDFDPDSDHSYGREEEEDDLDPGETDEKRRNFTAPTTPGTYYLYAYINRVDGEEGGIDQDWENNTSRNDDPPEYVKLVVQENTPGWNRAKWENLPDTTKAAIMSIIFD